MTQQLRIFLPHDESDANLRYWREQVTDALNLLPSFSIFSTDDGPNSSGVTADLGTVGVDTGSSGTVFWGKTSSGTTNWIEL